MTKDEKRHKALLAEMPCAVCGGFGVQLHHIRTGGWGKGDYKTLIPLCYDHHLGSLGIHTMGTKAWSRAFGNQQDLLAKVMEAVNGN